MSSICYGGHENRGPGIVRLTGLELADQKRLGLSRGELPPFSERGNAVLFEGHCHINRSISQLGQLGATLGATRLAALCRELEEMARENRISGAKAILSEIEKLYPSVCERLAAECESEVW